jgi:hypothetical protein
MATASKGAAVKAASSKKAASKKPRAKQATSKKTTSKSDAIRAYLDKHPDVGPTAVCTALKHQGIAITPAHVSNVRAAAARKAAKAAGIHFPTNGHGSGKRGRKPKAADAVSLAHLLEARRFAAQVGGVNRAVELLQSLARLQ